MIKRWIYDVTKWKCENGFIVMSDIPKDGMKIFRSKNEIRLENALFEMVKEYKPHIKKKR